MQEKRRVERMEAGYEVFMRDEEATHQCNAQNISIYGVGVVTDGMVQRGAQVDLSIIVPEANVTFKAKGNVKHCTPGGDGNERYLIGVEFTEGHEEGLPFIESDKGQYSHLIHQSIQVDLDIETCYRMLSDVTKFPEWDSGVESAEVVEKHPDGRPRCVRFGRNFLIKRVYYTDCFYYDDQNHSFGWESQGGDEMLVKNEGGYDLRSIGKDKTLVTFKANITVAIIPSKRLVNYFSSIAVRKELKNFKKYAEQTAA